MPTPPPNPYPAPGPSGAVMPPNYADTYPAMGLSGLAQGFTHGLELGHEWGNQAEELANKKEAMQNEADYRNAMLSQRAPVLLAQAAKDQAVADATPKKLALAATAESDRNTRAAAANAAKAAGAAGKGAAKDASALDMLNSLSSKWDTLGAGPVAGVELKGKSVFPSTDAAGYDAARTALAGRIDHDLNGRVNDVTIQSIKNALPGFFDTPESKAQKIAFIGQTYNKALASPAMDPHAQAVAWAKANPGDPRSAAILKINGR